MWRLTGNALYTYALKARNQVMQRNHEPAHDDSGWTANRLYNAVRLPKRKTIMVGLTMSVSSIHSRTQGIMSWNEEQGVEQGDIYRY